MIISDQCTVGIYNLIVYKIPEFSLFLYDGLRGGVDRDVAMIMLSVYSPDSHR